MMNTNFDYICQVKKICYMRVLFLLFAILFLASCSYDSQNKMPTNENGEQVKNTVKLDTNVQGYEVLSDTVISTVSVDMLPDKPPIFKHFDKKTFLDSLINSALNGKIQVYDFFDYTKLDIPEIKENLGMLNDTITVEDPATGKVTKKITNNFNIGNIRELVFVEEWLWNKSDNSVYKKVLAYGPVIYVVKDDSLGGYPVLKRVPFVVMCGK